MERSPCASARLGGPDYRKDQAGQPRRHQSAIRRRAHPFRKSHNKGGTMTATFFARVPMRAASDRRLTERALRALIVICGHANKTGRAWPGLQTIAEESGIDRRSLHRPIAQLETN